jgi:Ca2+-binding EF-hand superfamily protein
MLTSRLLPFALIAAAFPALATDAPASPPRTPALLTALDADRDGRPTTEEMRVARERQIAGFDRDGDRRLSAEEYQAGWLEAAQARLARQFRADDLDRDGAITLEELVERSTGLLRRRDRDRDGALTAEELRPRRRTPAAGPA